jgi:hypothetical protein
MRAKRAQNAGNALACRRRCGAARARARQRRGARASGRERCACGESAARLHRIAVVLRGHAAQPGRGQRLRRVQQRGRRRRAGLLRAAGGGET